MSATRDEPGHAGDQVRRFLAVGVPSEVRAELAGATAHLRDPATRLRVGPPTGWHVTLAFLGTVDDEQARVATEVLASTLWAAAPRPAPRLTVGGAGRFGDRVLFLALEDDSQGTLGRFVTLLHRELRAAGLGVPDRAFRPHVTLARARGRRGVRPVDVEAVRVPAASWRPEAVGRWASVPTATGPYTVEVELPWPNPD